jgi:predicted nicotinamide N-methyase
MSSVVDPGPLLALPWRLFPETLEVDGVVVPTSGVPNSGEGTGLTTWDGGIVLAKYLERAPALVRGRRVLELGAGTGAVGLAAAALGATSVLLTDLPYVQANLDANVAALGLASASVAVLDWTAPLPPDLPPVDVVVAADVVWLDELLPPFLATLDALLARAEAPVALLAHQTRASSTERALFAGLKARGLRVDEVRFEDLHPDARDPVLRVWRITR